jgi:hypothetical protein
LLKELGEQGTVYRSIVDKIKPQENGINFDSPRAYDFGYVARMLDLFIAYAFDHPTSLTFIIKTRDITVWDETGALLFSICAVANNSKVNWVLYLPAATHDGWEIVDNA